MASWIEIYITSIESIGIYGWDRVTIETSHVYSRNIAIWIERTAWTHAYITGDTQRILSMFCVLHGVIIIDEMEMQKLMEKSIDFWSEEKKKAGKESGKNTYVRIEIRSRVPVASKLCRQIHLFFLSFLFPPSSSPPIKSQLIFPLTSAFPFHQ